MNKPYKDGTPLYEILKDGWSRGFEPEQTQKEADLMGHAVPLDYIRSTWAMFQDDMDKCFIEYGDEDTDDHW